MTPALCHEPTSACCGRRRGAGRTAATAAAVASTRAAARSPLRIVRCQGRGAGRAAEEPGVSKRIPQGERLGGHSSLRCLWTVAAPWKMPMKRRTRSS